MDQVRESPVEEERQTRDTGGRFDLPEKLQIEDNSRIRGIKAIRLLSSSSPIIKISKPRQ